MLQINTNHGKLWKILGKHGNLWTNIETHGTFSKLHGKILETHGILLKHHGIFLKLHGKILEDFEVNSSITEIPYDSAGEPRGISP